MEKKWFKSGWFLGGVVGLIVGFFTSIVPLSFLAIGSKVFYKLGLVPSDCLYRVSSYTPNCSQYTFFYKVFVLTFHIALGVLFFGLIGLGINKLINRKIKK